MNETLPARGITTRELLLSLLVVILLLTTIIFWVRSATNSAKAAAAAELVQPLVTTLQNYDYPQLYPSCRLISHDDISVIKQCLEQGLESRSLEKRFRQSAFKNADEQRNVSGYLVIENAKGGSTFESAKFVLRQNNEVIASGCTTPGEIKPGFTCRFDLVKACVPGDNLEVT